MIQEIVHHVLKPRHYWRKVGFTELSELYVSNMLRVLAISVQMVFVPFYMYQHGYDVPSIFALFGWFFAGRMVFDIIAAYMVARVGPKHTMILSSMLQIVVAAVLLSVPVYHWPVWQMGPLWGASASFFFIAYHVAFSKVKHNEHAGRELGYAQIMEKIGGVAGPLIGGVAGSVLGGQYIFIAASLLLFASLWPLFRSSEPVRTRQKLNYTDLPLSKIRRDLLSYAALGVENTLCLNLWPLYIALFALSGGIYLQLGVLSSIAVLVSITAAHYIGRYVDRGNARNVLRVGAIINALVYVWRPFVGSALGVLATNIINEAVTTAYRLPYIKGMYAAADDLTGFRIVYVSSMEAFASTIKATAWFLLAVLATFWSAHTVIIIGFATASIASTMIMGERFKALSPKVYNANHE